MNKTMLSAGVSLSMRPADYKRKVRTIVGDLTRDERATVERHFDDGLTAERSAEILLSLRKWDRNARAMREMDEERYRESVEL